MSFVAEHFSGGSLPSPWSAITAATGSIAVTDHGVQGALAANGDAAAIVRAFDHTRDAIYWFCAAAKYTGSSLTPWPAMRLMHSATQPVAGTRASFNILCQHVYYSPSVTYDRINYSINPTGTNQNWQESSQSWATGGTVISTPAEAPDSDYRLYGMQWDATNARVRWMYGHTVSGSSENPDYGPKIVTVTDWVSLSSILNGTSTTLWLVLGWPENNFWIGAGSFHIEWFTEQYGTQVDVYCNGKATIGGTYNITHHMGYDLRCGMFVPGTRGQIAIDKSASGWDSSKTQWGSAIRASDGTFVQSYNGDAGGTALQIGIATATSPFGPWTKYASNPVIASVAASGTDWEQYTRFNVIVEDTEETDAAKRYKLIVNMTDASSTTRTGIFYSASYFGPYTYDGRLLEDDATETQIAFRGRPVWYAGEWHLFYNAQVGGVNCVRYAHGPHLRAGMMTKANVTLNTEGVGGVEVTLTAVSGRTWTVADTTGLVKDMLLICTKTSSGDTYDVTRVRKVISSTQFEVYHTCAGAAVGTVCRSANYGTDNALNYVTNIGGTWYFVMTTFKAFTSHPSYGAHHEWNALFVGGSSPFDAMAIDWFASPIAPMGRDAWNTTISNENVRVMEFAEQIKVLEAGLAIAVTSVEDLTAPGAAGAALAATPALALTTTDALSVAKPLAAAPNVAVTVTEDLSIPKPLAAAPNFAVTATEALSVPKPLASALALALTTGPDLSAGGSGAALVAALNLALTASSDATVPKPLAAAAGVVFTSAEALTVPKDLAASVAAAVTLQADLSGGTATLGTSLTLAVAQATALTVPKDLGAALAVALTDSADLTALGGAAALQAALSMSVTPAALLSIPKPLTTALALAFGTGVTLTSVVSSNGVSMIAGVLVLPELSAPLAIAARLRGAPHLRPSSAS